MSTEIESLAKRKMDLAHNLALIKTRLKDDFKSLRKTEESIESITNRIIALTQAEKKIKYSFED